MPRLNRKTKLSWQLKVMEGFYANVHVKKGHHSKSTDEAVYYNDFSQAVESDSTKYSHVGKSLHTKTLTVHENNHIVWGSVMKAIELLMWI